MTTEELAALVVQDDTAACTELWERVRRFVAQQARRYHARFEVPGFDVDDLINAGFFALLEACSHFEPERAGFLTCLDWYLKTVFAEVAGLRRPTQRHDASNVADSLDRPVGGENEDIRLLDILPSHSAARSIADVESRLFTDQLHTELEKALDRISPRKAEVLRLRYFRGINYEAQAKAKGISKQAVSSQAEDALWELRFDDKSIRELSAFLYGEEVSLDIDALCIRIREG